MDFRMLESLQQAIPILFRHLDAYVELAERDLAVAKAVAIARLQALAVLAVSGTFALLFVCVFIVALAWDTAYRLHTIGGLAALFVAGSVWAAISLTRPHEGAFATVRNEWREDRALLHRLLARDHAERVENA